MRSSRRRPRVAHSALFFRIGVVGPLALLLVIGLGGPTQAASDRSDPEASSPTEILERIWPKYPEWLAMLAEILAGHTLSPEQGWFRKAVTKTRFDWPVLADRFDANRDGSISRAEFHARKADFDRLDRDRDGVLTAADLDFSNRSRDGSDIESFITADADGDGKVSRQELMAFRRQTEADPIYRRVFSSTGQELEDWLALRERDGPAFLTLADFQEAFTLKGQRTASPGGTFRPQILQKVDTSVLLRAFLRQEIGAFAPGPELNGPAPDFTLKTIDGGQEVALSRLVGSKPLVLIFGNYTCGPFRGHSGSLDRLYGRYKDRANFVVVYTRESHPADGWQFEENRARGVSLTQPRNSRERSSVAQTCRVKLGLGMPVVVDTMDDQVGSLYSGLPNRAYLIDRQGKIAYKGGRGPFGFEPASLEQSLILLLHSDAASDPRSAGSVEEDEETPAPSGLVFWTDRAGRPLWPLMGVACVILGLSMVLGFAWIRRSRRPAGSSSITDQDTAGAS